MDFPSVPLIVGLVIDLDDRVRVERLLLSLEAARKAGAPRFQLLTLVQGAIAKSLEGLSLGRVRHAETRITQAAGHNRLLHQAFSSAATRWYLRLDQYALVHPDMISELIAQQSRLPRTGIIEAARFPDEHPKHYDPETGETPWCCGTAMLLTRELYENIGGFDEHVTTCDDVDLSWRARVAGFKIATASKALVSVCPPESPAGELARGELLRAGAYLAAKWGSGEFKRRCSDDFALLTGAPLELPKVGTPSAEMTAVADFSAGFQFAPCRW